jgi:membrane-bound lytic murein transglycosylase D
MIKQLNHNFTSKSFTRIAFVFCAMVLCANPVFAKTATNKNTLSKVKVTQQVLKLKRKTQVKKHPKLKKSQKNLKVSNESKLAKNIKSTPHLEYVSEQLKKRNLPTELAMLPMIESHYQTTAVSNRGAVGIWQFMPETAKQYGLKDRTDVKASTTAALTYLQYLHKKCNKDWMLALAAYNAGEGTVERAIAKNRKAGKPTSFWSLKLPKQTREYVPKFLAMNKIASL